MSGPTASADCAVAANRVSGATNGTWSISCSDPCPHRNAGARPPSTTSGDWFCCAAAIALIPLVTPGPAVERGDAGHPGHLRPAFGGECGGLLVAGVDQPDVLGAAAVVDGEQVPAGEREDGVDAAGAQPSGNQMSGVDRNWSLDAHGRSIIAAMSEAPETQVLIAGAGPIGMTAAIELARRGIACRIVDPLVEPPQYAKAVGVQPRTLEVFEGMGVLRRVLDAALLMRGQIVYVNGERVSQLDMTLPDDVPFGFIAIPQYATEAILRDELAMHGVQVQRGVQVTGFEQDADGVTATLAGDAGEQTVRAAYLVGADGAHSAVRKGLGLTFEGAAFEEQYMLGDVEVGWSAPRGYGVRSMHQTDGKTDDLLVCIPLPGRGRYRMSMLVPDELDRRRHAAAAPHPGRA